MMALIHGVETRKLHKGLDIVADESRRSKNGNLHSGIDVTATVHRRLGQRVIDAR
jgi:hypothetical protein